MHGDNIRKAIKKAVHGNEVRRGVNEYGRTAWNSWMHKDYPMENAMKTDKDTKYTKKSGAKPGNEVKKQVDKVKDKNTRARGANDYFASTEGVRKWDQGKRAFDDGTKNSKSTAPKYKAEAGSGSIPSGTNTNVPGMIGRKKRKDGSYGC